MISPISIAALWDELEKIGMGVETLKALKAIPGLRASRLTASHLGDVARQQRNLTRIKSLRTGATPASLAHVPTPAPVQRVTAASSAPDILTSVPASFQ